ncbi:acylphosphatase [Cellulomonas denverensis]|uniref:Acylphosphatase n=1 Tax=Cellulomonas denverensis TaxID=264297 RepID=A0A7X6KW90_9CELL|nr:acylphosphatase [Cellulomonas denverensis]NKY23416.1 acylphosphatase [Cellulomonas denverensis]GIG25103.1 acylphosphatase [Cellulomonas denverensis]
MRRWRVIVEGRVQGVGFRWSAAREAERLGLSGWVANRDDGTVEAVIEGDEPAGRAMLDWLRHGPRGAHVDRTTVAEEQPEGLQGFGVQR